MNKPTVGKVIGIHDLMEEIKHAQAEEEKKFNAMTPEEREAYVEECKVKDAEAMELFAKAGGGIVLNEDGVTKVEGK